MKAGCTKFVVLVAWGVLTSLARAQTDEAESDRVGFGVADEPDDKAASEGEPNEALPAEDQVGFGPELSPSGSISQPVEDAGEAQLELSGFYRGEAGIWTLRTENSLAKLRQSADASLRYSRGKVRFVAGAHAEYDPAYLYARSQYDKATIDDYEVVIIGGETYLSASLGALELTVGRQIVPYGEGEVLSVVDLVNPRDMREPGQADLDDLRIAVTASRLGAFWNDNRLELMVVHESYFGLRPPPLAPYSPLRAALLRDATARALLADKELSYRDVPGRFSAADQQFFARFSRRGRRADFAVLAASLDYREGVFRLPGLLELEKKDIELELRHPRYTFLGHSTALPVGPLVLKWELAMNFARPFNVGQLSGLLPQVEQRRFDAGEWMLGIAYQPSSSLQLGLEAKQTVIFGGPEANDPDFLLPVSAVWVAARYAQSFFRERVQLNGLFVTIGDPRRTGFFARSDIAFALADALKLSVGYVAYYDGDRFGPLYGFGRNDRLFVRVRRDFSYP